MAKDKFSDKHFMKLALKQAAKGFYTTSPNPAVGCVIVRNGKILGKGYHHQAGQPHAEVMAMRDAQERHEDIRGATVYVTLEPCSHYGRTPPCAKALCDAGVRRVVMATLDPNPKVAGRGKVMLEEAGIEVRVGVCARKAEDLNRAFLYSITAKRPWVFTKHAISLDGKVALASGESRWITGLEARSDVQRLRLWSDAIITSHETVKADNPRMNVRVRELPEDVRKRLDLDLISSPLKVIIDSHGTLCRDRNTALLEPYGIFATGENYIVVGTHEPFAAIDPEPDEVCLEERASQVAATSLEESTGAGAAHKVLVCNKNTPRVSKKLEQPSNKAAAADTAVSADATTTEAAPLATSTTPAGAASQAQAEKTAKSKAKAKTTSKAASKGKAARKAKAAAAAQAEVTPQDAAIEAQAAAITTADATTAKASAQQTKRTQGKGKKGTAAPATAAAAATAAADSTSASAINSTAATAASSSTAVSGKSDELADQAQGLRQLSENRKEAALASALAEAERITSAADAAQEAAEAAVERDANSAFGVVSGASSELNVKHSLTAAMTAEAMADEADDAAADACAAADAAEAMALEFPTKAKVAAAPTKDTFATAEESLAAALSASAAQDKAAHKGKKAKGKKELVNADFEQAAAAAVVAAQAEAAAQAVSDSDSDSDSETTTVTKAKGKTKNKAKHHGAKGKVGKSMLAATDPLRTFVPKVLLQGNNFRVEAWTEHTSIVYVPMVKDAQGQEHASLEAVLDFLGAKEIRVAMVEAGGKLSSAFMAEGLINECYCYVSPMLLGEGAREGFVLPEIAHLSQALRFSKVEITQLGHDVRLDLRGPIFGEGKGGN